MTRRSVFASGSRLLLREALGGRLKPRAKADVHLPPAGGFCALRGVRQDVIGVRPSSLLVSAFLLCYFFRFSKRRPPHADQLGLVKYQYLSMTAGPGFLGPSQDLSRT